MQTVRYGRRVLADTHRHALELVCQRLVSTPVDWAVSGSAALALQGVPVSCADLDLATTALDAGAVERALAGHVIEPVGRRARGAIRGHLGRSELASIEVEILGDVQNLLPDGTWTPPPRLDEHTNYVALNGRRCPVLDLSYLRAVYVTMGRTDTVHLIDDRLLAELIAVAEERSYARLVLAPSARAAPFFQRSGFVAADESSGELLLVRSAAGRHAR